MISRIDATSARALPGVVAVLTGLDWQSDGHGDVPGVDPPKRRGGKPGYRPPRPAITFDRVRHVGQIVAMVIAETIPQAKDAAEQISVEYDPLPSMTDTARIGMPGTPELWQGCPDNETFFYTLGDKSAVDAAFGIAHHVTTVKSAINRVTAATMEPRCCIGD